MLPALIYVNEAVLFGELLVPRLLRRSCRFGFFSRICDVRGLEILLIVTTSIG